MSKATVTPFPISKVMTPPEAAALLKISQKTLLKMAKAGEIPSRRAGSLWRFHAAALENWMNPQGIAA